MKLLDSICAPGTLHGGLPKRGSGDDRYLFDESAGIAVVIDGATDVGLVRLYPDAESDAAHFADALAHVLLANPARADETPQAYFPRIAPILRDLAARDARLPLKDVPPASLPTAAATWLRVRDGRFEGATLGDTLAIVRSPSGEITVLGDGGKPADEQKRAQRVMALTEAERKQWLIDTRAIHNTPNGYWVFGVQPEAAAKIVHHTAPAPTGARALLVTDGFYRLVSPYRVYTDESLIEAAGEKGLGQLLTELRALESNSGDDARIGRFKTSDDATAALIEA